MSSGYQGVPNKILKFGGNNAWTDLVAISNGPTGLAYGNSALYVSTWGDGKVTKLHPSSGATQATYTGFSKPNGLALDASGNLYVVSFGAAANGSQSSVSKVTTDGTVTSIVSADKLCGAAGAAVLGDYLYVSNGDCAADASKSNRILKIKI